MVMMGVCTFGSLAVLSKKLAIQTQFRNAALTFARQQLDTLSTATYTKLSPGDRVPVPVPSAFIAALASTEQKGYNIQAEYLVDAGPTPTLRQVTVHVFWRSKATHGGANRSPISEIRLAQLVAMQPPDPNLKA